jgi:hypothetical protein
MKIQKKKDNMLYVTDSAKLLIVYNSKNIDTDGIDIVVNKSENPLEIEGPFLIDTCGEYEEKNIMVQALSSLSEEKIDFVSLDNEGINVIVVDSQTQVPNKRTLEQVGINNVLVFKQTNGLGKLFDLIDNFSPQFLIPITDDPIIMEQICKHYTLLPEEKVKSFSLTSEELPDDEEGQPLSLVSLE